MIFDDQISKRLDREKQTLREVFGDTARDMGFKLDFGNSMGSDNRVLHRLLEYLKVSDYHLDDDGIFTPDEQLERILRPRGIMQRRITLDGDWWHRRIFRHSYLLLRFHRRKTSSGATSHSIALFISVCQ